LRPDVLSWSTEPTSPKSSNTKEPTGRFASLRQDRSLVIGPTKTSGETGRPIDGLALFYRPFTTTLEMKTALKRKPSKICGFGTTAPTLVSEGLANAEGRFQVQLVELIKGLHAVLQEGSLLAFFKTGNPSIATPVMRRITELGSGTGLGPSSTAV
jgi:hypothetical protein